MRHRTPTHAGRPRARPTHRATRLFARRPGRASEPACGPPRRRRRARVHRTHQEWRSWTSTQPQLRQLIELLHAPFVVAEDEALILNPGVGKEASVLASHADVHRASSQALRLQQLLQRDRLNQTLGLKEAVPRHTRDGLCQTLRRREVRRLVRRRSGGTAVHERQQAAATSCPKQELGATQRDLSVEEISPVASSQPAQFLQQRLCLPPLSPPVRAPNRGAASLRSTRARRYKSSRGKRRGSVWRRPNRVLLSFYK